MSDGFYEKWEYRRWLSASDVSLCSPATRGIWFDALNRMMERSTYKVSGTPEQLAQACRCTVVALSDAMIELKRECVADVHEANGVFTLVCRLRQKRYNISYLRKSAGSAGGTSTQAKIKHTCDYDYDYYSSFWKSYPRKVSKSDGARAWLQVKGEKHLPAILAALAWQCKSPDWLKDGGKFIPYPASYLRGRRWEDQPPAPPKRTWAP